MPSFSRIAVQSLPLTLFLMVCFVGLVALMAIPSVGEQLGPIVCSAGEVMVAQTTPYSLPGESGTSVDYFCESDAGRIPVDMSRMIFAAVIAYVIAWMVIVWPIISLIRYNGAKTEQRLDHEGIPARVRIDSVEQTRMVVNRMPVMKYGLHVEPEGRPAFQTTMRKTTPELFIPYLKPGSDVIGIVDPKRPNSVILRFDEIARHVAAQEASQTPNANSELGKLRALKTMLDEGLIEQAEYDAKKANIMERM